MAKGIFEFMRIRRWQKPLTILVAALGFLSSFLQVVTTTYSNTNLFIGIFFIVIIAISIFVILYILPKDNLPEGLDVVADEIENSNFKNGVKIVFPCDNSFFEAANKLAKEKFGKNSVSSKTVNDWQKRNELILTCITDRNRLVGYFDILPLRTEFAMELINGKKSEKDIKAGHILGVHQMKNAEYVYFAGIAVQDTESGRGCIYGTYLIWAAFLYISLFYGKNLRKILTIPTSESGLKIANHLEFTLERDGNLRKDGLDIYSKEFNIESVSNDLKQNKNLYKRFNIDSYFVEFERNNGEKSIFDKVLHG